MLFQRQDPLVHNLSLYLLDSPLTPLALEIQSEELSRFAEHCEHITPDRALETFSRVDPDYMLATKRLLSEQV